MMGFFRRRVEQQLDLTIPPVATVVPAEAQSANVRRGGESEIYSVRVFKGFKSEVLKLLGELQVSRQSSASKARRVTEREVAELMLSALQVKMRDGDVTGDAEALANDIWIVARQIGRGQGLSGAQVIEQLVAQRAADLGLLDRRLET